MTEPNPDTVGLPVPDHIVENPPHNPAIDDVEWPDPVTATAPVAAHALDDDEDADEVLDVPDLLNGGAVPPGAINPQ